MKSILILCLGLVPFSFSQVEKELPLATNPDLQGQKPAQLIQKSNGTFDSTFIYTTDTITLPFFDDFSKNKFQNYIAGYSDPGVTSAQFFQLLDGSSIPLSADSIVSLVPTYTRYFTEVNGIYTFTDTLHDVINNIQIGYLDTYPVTYNFTPVYPAYNIYDTLGFVNLPDTLFQIDDIVKQDSARQFFKQITDPSKLWLDANAYHNYRYAVNPWTIGVATFDGLDEYGYPYSFGSNGSNYADVLTSKPIDLSGNTIGDSIYLSFLYQKQGFGEEPETTDFFAIELFNPALNQWTQVWSVSGGPVSDFKGAHIPIVDLDYFNSNFQFRFRNYGSLTGGLDHFHIDYVRVRKNSFLADTLYKDFAFVYPTGSLLKDYTSVPWDHFKNNSTGKMNDLTKVVVRNGSNLPENNQNGNIEIKYNGVSEGNFVLAAQNLSGGAINYAPTTTYYSYHDLSGGYVFDVSKPGTKQTFDIITDATAPFTDSAVNDTTYTTQYFANYYAYDDGTAERAYSFTGAQGRLAMGFETYEADTIIGASIHFTPTVVNAEGSLFVITVWSDNNGVPGDTIYQDNLFSPKVLEYDFGPNRFINYYTDSTRVVPVSGKFYIGWRQFNAEPLNVGLDKNIDKSQNLFYSLNGGNSWTNSLIEGTVMIRPIFSTSLNDELGIAERTVPKTNFVLYPNPANEQITLKADNGLVQGMSVYNLQGQLVVKTDQQTTDVSHLKTGVYLVKPADSEQTIRLIKN